jgi:cytochrome P450
MDALLPMSKKQAPFAWYRAMRASKPVFYDADADCWQVFRYDDVLRIAMDHATFSSEARQRMIARVDPDEGDERGDRMAFPPTIVSMDPPRHRELRSLVTQAFTPRAVAQLAPRITQIANELLDRVIPSGTMDVMDDLAAPLPVTVIAEMLGVSAADTPTFMRWSDALLAADGEASGASGASGAAEVGRAALRSRSKGQRLAAERAAQEMRSYFAATLAERRQHHRDDLIGGLLAAEVDGQRLSEDDLLGFCMLLLVAGNITTTN